MKEKCEICGMFKMCEIAKETVFDYINDFDTSDIIIENYGVEIKTVSGCLIRLTDCNHCNARILKTISSL